MQIIIYYQHVNREYGVCNQLADWLSKKGYETHVLSIGLEWGKGINIAKHGDVVAVIMPWMYSDSNYRLVSPFVKHNKDVLIINTHQEEIASPVRDQLILPQSENCRDRTIHLVWGSHFEKKLIDMGTSPNLIYKTGNMRTDLLHETQSKRNEYAVMYKLDSEKQWIIFSENRDWVKSVTDTLVSDRINGGMSKDEFEEYLDINKKSLELTYQQINELDDDFFTKYEFIYRSHPGHQSPKNLNSKVKIINNGTIYDWLSCVDANVVWGSTCAFESELMGVATFIHEPIPNIEKYKTYGISEYQHIDNICDINKKSIEQTLAFQKSKKIYLNYFGIVDGNRVKYTAEVIDNLVKKSPVGYLPRVLEMNRKAYVTRRLYEIIAFISIKTRVLKVFKFPKSVWKSREDIPPKF